MLGLPCGFDLFKVTWKMQPVARMLALLGHFDTVWAGQTGEEGSTRGVQQCDEGLNTYGSSRGREVCFFVFLFFFGYATWLVGSGSPVRD